MLTRPKASASFWLQNKFKKRYAGLDSLSNVQTVSGQQQKKKEEEKKE